MMMIKKIVPAIILVSTILTSCSNSKTTELNSDPVPKDTLSSASNKPVNSYIAMFEIPALDISRAINFYQGILDIKIEKMEMPGMEMGVLPYEDQLITGVIVKAEGYTPSADGIAIYLNAGDNLQIMLDKVVQNGGKIITPKTAHADGSGYFALILDSEGNKLGLNSPK